MERRQPAFRSFSQNFGGLQTLYGANGAVFGDTITLNPTTILDFRSSYLRALHGFLPQQTGTNLAMYGPARAALASQLTLPQAPLPSVSGFAGFRIIGRHSLKFGGEARRWDWGFVQSNTAGGSFTFNNVFTAWNPLSPANTGYSYASYLLGTPTSGSLAGAAQTFQQIYYQGYYLTDSYRVTNKLTVNLGVRLDVIGSFSERFNRTVVFQPGAADPPGQSVGMNLQGQLALVASPSYPSRNQLGSAKVAPAPCFGFAWSLDNSTVIRGGYRMNWVSPEQIDYTLAPFQSPINAATTTMVTPVNGGLTPLNTLSNPFPNGLIEPEGHNIALLRKFEGQTFNAPIPGPHYPYVQQFNLELQRQFKGLLIDLGYAGSKATHLPYSCFRSISCPINIWPWARRF